MRTKSDRISRAAQHSERNRCGCAGDGYRVWIVMLMASCVVFCGCSGDDAVLPISNFTTWKLPADETRIPAPRALYTSASDTVYALDDAGRVLVYSATGDVLKTWHMPEHDVGRPEGIIELQDGRIAVADTHYHRIVYFHGDGAVESTMGEKGTGPGQFVYPVAIAQDPAGFIYVGEYGDRQRIQKFTAAGEFVVQFGEHGTGPGQFQRPSGIIWSEGDIYAVDAFNNRIQVFEDSGAFRGVLEFSDNFSGLEFPYDIRAGADGMLYVVENMGGRITVFQKDGTVIGRYGQPGRTEGRFLTPWSLTLMSDGRILVADTGNHRIVELTP